MFSRLTCFLGLDACLVFSWNIVKIYLNSKELLGKRTFKSKHTFATKNQTFVYYVSDRNNSAKNQLFV